MLILENPNLKDHSFMRWYWKKYSQQWKYFGFISMHKLLTKKFVHDNLDLLSPCLKW